MVKRLAPTERFDWRARLADALFALSQEPAQDHIERPALRGIAIARFVLPLRLCPPLNRLSRAGTASAGWALGKMKREALGLMQVQLQGKLPKEPLPGRPQVLCVRFSSVEPDHESGWCKNPVDRLRVGKMGLGFLVDDAPRFLELRTWWEPAKRSCGFVFVELRA
jgi:hypothetical protein